jgi:hypothetical protein
MSKIKSLKSLYGLEYDKSNYQSSLINWYNRLIDKSADELSIMDVSRMIHQNILKEVAIDKAVELFLSEPFGGEMQDGDLLTLLVSCGSEITKSKKIELLIDMVHRLGNEVSEFDWENEDNKTLFERNIISIKRVLFQNEDIELVD